MEESLEFEASLEESSELEESLEPEELLELVEGVDVLLLYFISNLDVVIIVVFPTKLWCETPYSTTSILRITLALS